MTDLRKAAEMALEALLADQYDMVAGDDGNMEFKTEKAIEALRQALAQDEQEPDNWWDNKEYVKSRFGDSAKIVGVKHGLPKDVFKQTQPDPEHFCDTHCVHTDHHPDCELAQPEQDEGVDGSVRMFVKRNGVFERVDTVEKAFELSRGMDTAQPEQEPVAWMHVQGRYEEPNLHELDDEFIERGWDQYPLYTAPPKREWVGLTDDEIRDIHWSKPMDEYSYARAIEAKLKEKNNG